jgi:hypothetical protein
VEAGPRRARPARGRYRELGEHVMATILEKVPDGATLEDLFRQVEADLTP